MLETSACTTGPLNQYTAIGRGEEAAFEPVYDADGNQTLIRTSTGIWQVTYNAENRPVRFVNESAKTVVECTYDYMGRQHTRKVSVNGTVSSYLRYMYCGYLQIAAIDAVSGAFRWFLFRDPTQHYAPATYPQRRHLVRLRVGSDRERHGNLRESRLPAHSLHLHALRRSHRRRGRHPAHPVEQRIQRRGTGACLLQLPASQSARRQVDQQGSRHGTGWVEFVRLC